MVNYNSAMVKENVSCETFFSISTYVQLLKLWNNKVALISKKLKEDQIYEHILDSVVSANLIQNKDSKIIDVGSGNGIVGMVFSIIGFTNCTLIDVSLKKTTFLLEVANTLHLNVKIKQTKVQNFHTNNVQYILSKAMSTLTNIILITYHLISPTTQIIVYKNITQVGQEISDALQRWQFEYSLHANQYDNKKYTLLIKNVQRRIPHDAPQNINESYHHI